MGKAEESLAAYAAITKTRKFQRKLWRSTEAVEAWLEVCERPVVSCGGGKDSTALLQLVHSVNPAVRVFCANPPNPLPDREPHVRRLELADGAPWVHVPYPWNVEAVLAGQEPYPALLKIRKLEAEMEADGVDGVALGIRAEESAGRRANLNVRGLLYLHSSGRWTCTPIAHWTADEVVGFILAADLLPLNPVYFKRELAPPLNYLRDGTWYPREIADGRGYREWLAYHYPDLVEQYRKAVLVGG